MARKFIAFNGVQLIDGLPFRKAAKLNRTGGWYVTSHDSWRLELREHGRYRLVEPAGRFTREKYHFADLTASAANWAVQHGWGPRAERQRLG